MVIAGTFVGVSPESIPAQLALGMQAGYTFQLWEGAFTLILTCDVWNIFSFKKYSKEGAYEECCASQERNMSPIVFSMTNIEPMMDSLRGV